MVKRLVIILILIPLLCLSVYSQNQQNDQLLRETIVRYRQAAVRIPLPDRKSFKTLSYMASINSVRGKYAEIGLSSLNVEWFISQNYDYSIIPEPDPKSLVTAATIAEAKGWTSYPTFTQYDSIMRSFVNLYPSQCKLDTIGFSVYGKLVMALKISNNPKKDQDKPEVFYTSTIHGDELGGFVLMMRFAEYLLKNYTTNQRVRDLVDNLEIWINPLSNPDGTYGTGNIISSPTRNNAHGINLNRNFPDPNGRELPEQIETTDMIRFMRSHHFVISANFHAGDEVVNYPWDRWPRLHPDNDWFYDISRKYADTVHLYAAANYMTELDDGITNGYEWYYIYGGRQDFMTYELQGREVTIELDYTKQTPTTRLDALWQYNWHSFIGYLENALYGIHGIVTDDSNGNPVKAMIYINSHDKDSSQVYSDSLTGSFTRLIAPGIWTLIVSAKGYYSATISNISVVDGNPVNLDISLTPIINAIDTIATPVIKIYPDPASEFIRIIFPERQKGKVNVKIFNSLGMKVADYPDTAYDDTPLVFTVHGLSSGCYSVMITNESSGVIDRGRFVVVRGL